MVSRRNEGIVYIGHISGKYESGNNYAVVAKDGDSASYGYYQFNHRAGTVRDFLNYLEGQRNDPIAQEIAYRLKENFIDADNPNGQFAKAWRQVANDEELSKRFALYQHRFAIKRYYIPVQKELLQYGFKPSEVPQAVKEALFSASIQHGPAGAKKMIAVAVQSMRDRNDWDSFLECLYRKRRDCTPPKIHKRYEMEFMDVAKLWKTEKNTRLAGGGVAISEADFENDYQPQLSQPRARNISPRGITAKRKILLASATDELSFDTDPYADRVLPPPDIPQHGRNNPPNRGYHRYNSLYDTDANEWEENPSATTSRQQLAQRHPNSQDTYSMQRDNTDEWVEGPPAVAPHQSQQPVQQLQPYPPPQVYSNQSYSPPQPYSPQVVQQPPQQEGGLLSGLFGGGNGQQGGMQGLLSNIIISAIGTMVVNSIVSKMMASDKSSTTTQTQLANTNCNSCGRYRR